MVCRAIGRTCQGHVTDPKTLPLYNKLKESKVNSRNVLSAQPSWVNRRSPPRLPGRRPAARAPASPGRPLPAPPPAALSAGGRRAGGLGSPPRLPHLVLSHPPHPRPTLFANIEPLARTRGRGLPGEQGSSLQHPQHSGKCGVPRALPNTTTLPVLNSQSPFLLAFPRKP